MDKVLHIGEGLTLPLQVAARTTAILAQKGAGKTYTGMRMMEELLGHGQQVVAMDPTGVWWGLRAPGPGRDGKAFDVIVLGGEHADAPLEPTAGAIVAEFAVSSGKSLVLDLSGFESNAAQDRFATDFMLTLYRAKAAARQTLHLMMDEADSFAPQRPMEGQQRMLGAAEAIVRRGRSRGLGMTMISQRPAVLNKNVLSQVDLLIAGRVVGLHDHKALGDWASISGSPAQCREFLDSLPRLAVGEAWFWSPGWLDIFQRVKVSRRVSFDSSRTPEPGEPAPAPKMAQVSLESLSAEIQASAERVKERDPKELRAEVARLKSTVQGLHKQLDEKPKEEAIPPTVLAKLSQDLRVLDKQLHQTVCFCVGIRRDFGALLEKFGVDREALRAKLPTRLQDGAEYVAAAETGTVPAVTQVKRVRGSNGRVATVTPTARGTGGGPHAFSKAERAALQVLAQYHPESLDKRRLALIAGYAVSGGGFNNALSSLRTGGWIEGSSTLGITEKGLADVGTVEPLPTGMALLEYWRSQLPKAESGILYQLAHAPDRTLVKGALAMQTGYAVDGGGFNNALSKLRTLCLISGKAKLSLAEDLRP